MEMLCPDTLTFDDLKTSVDDGIIDTVLACFVDMQGRLMGKRFHARNFVETSFMKKPIAATICWPLILRWRRRWLCLDQLGSGYGDYVMKPDLDTFGLCHGLRALRWCCAMC